VVGRIFMAALVLTACAHWFPSEAARAEADKSPQQRFAERWVGHPVDDVILQYGKPTDRAELRDGNHVVLFYHREAINRDGYGRVGMVFCDRKFEIDKAFGMVRRALITGSGCD